IQGPKIVQEPLDSGLPLSGGGSAFTTSVFGACSTFTHVMARRLAEPPEAALYVEGSRRFVASPTTPTASGRNDKIPGWVSHPPGSPTLARRTPEAPAKHLRWRFRLLYCQFTHVELAGPLALRAGNYLEMFDPST